MNKIFIIVALTVFTFVVGCSKNREDAIVGTWKSITLAGNNSTTTYLKDGTIIEKGSLDGHEWEIRGTWKILDDGKIEHQRIESDVTNTTTFAYSIDGDIMTRHFEFKRMD
jgi:hypothetical protein